MRWEERSAERAASPWSPCSDSASSSRLASTLVSGVRSSCEASATKLALAREHRLGLAARGVELAEHALERARELGDLVVGLRTGASPREGSRVRAISAAVLVSSAIGAIARRAIAMPASSARPAAGEHAEQQEQLDARDGRLGVGDAAAVLDDHAARSARRCRRCGRSAGRLSTR